MENDIKIPISNLKRSLLFLGCIAFFVVGYYMFNAESSRKYPQWFLELWGVITMVFSGVCGVFLLSFYDRNKGIIINEEGIWDNTSMISVGLVKWEDIQQIRKMEIGRTPHIILDLKPQKMDLYINKIKNPIKRKFLAFNMKQFGYAITATMLKIKSEELYSTLQSELNKYKERKRDERKEVF